MYEQELVEYGLNEKEAKVYLALLELGMSTANEIAEKADLVRTTTYDVLKGLREKGIVGKVIKNKIIYFEAAEPEKLIQLTEEKGRKIKKIISQLKGLRGKKKELLEVELFEGKEGIKTVYQDILNERKQLLAFSNTHFIYNVLPFYVPHFVNQRVKKKIFIKLLTEKTKESLSLMKGRDKFEMRETRFVEEMKDIPITEYIYGDNIAVLGTDIKNPMGLIIRNKDFAKAQKLLFDLAWKNSRK
ncbi:MAG: helix-turn-helix domain-containing protein [Nanoarchaeota archaeon]